MLCVNNDYCEQAKSITPPKFSSVIMKFMDIG